ncbi:DUF6273 domain-containing protein [Dysosmobacter sp.]|uniref:DUF6273 domain-containing protein n=1 Tax=Dysosmobacter sp. TaxID=2591382 RepID=UPI003A8D0AC5
MGRVIMSGIVPPLTAPVTGVLASSLAVGTTVKLMEGGTAVEYLVVNQGIPSNSSLYDASCDGTWLLRKDIHSERQWNTSNVNEYETSAINTWRNGDFFNTLGSIEQASVKQVKIPYCTGGGDTTINSGANGLSVKVFLLGCYEVGWTTSDYSLFNVDGAKLEYFIPSTGSAADNKRTAKLNGREQQWMTRTPVGEGNGAEFVVTSSGSYDTGLSKTSDGVRPALILPGNALFDKTTMLLKGVK